MTFRGIALDQLLKLLLALVDDTSGGDPGGAGVKGPPLSWVGVTWPPQFWRYVDVTFFRFIYWLWTETVVVD